MNEEIKKNTAVDRPHAPVVYFETVAACANINGLIGVTLGTLLHSPQTNGGVITENIITSYLRTNIAGATDLRNMLDTAILLAKPAESATKN